MHGDQLLRTSRERERDVIRGKPYAAELGYIVVQRVSLRFDRDHNTLKLHPLLLAFSQHDAALVVVLLADSVEVINDRSDKQANHEPAVMIQ